MKAIPLNSPTGVFIIPVAVEHAMALASLVQKNSAHLRNYLPAVVGLSSAESASEHLRLAVESSASAEIFEWHLFVDGTLCGAVRIKDVDERNRKAKIAYYIGQQFTGKGIVSSSVSTILEFCFKSLNLNRIELRCASGNEPSMRIAERLGFVHEGILRQEEYLNGDFVDQHVYGLLAKDFSSFKLTNRR